MNHKKLIHTAHEKQVAIIPLIGPRFFETDSKLPPVSKKEELLKLLGIDTFGKITNREKDILRLLCFGYPASYIGKELHLSPRTIENTIAILKSKLNCSSKVELINKSIDITQMIKICKFMGRKYSIFFSSYFGKSSMGFKIFV